MRDEHQRAAPLVLQSNQRLRRADPIGHVDVVAATVCHKRLATVPFGLDATGIRKIGFLFHRQRVELGAHHDSRAVAVAVDGDEAGPANLFGHLEAERAHFGSQLCRGLHLLEGKFGMGVQILVERVELRIVGLERSLDRRLEARNVHFRIGGRESVDAQRGGHKKRFC